MPGPSSRRAPTRDRYDLHPVPGTGREHALPPPDAGLDPFPDDHHVSAPGDTFAAAYGGERLGAPYDDEEPGVAYAGAEELVVPYGDPLGSAGLSGLVRPGPPRTWRERLDDALAASPGPGRMLAAVVLVAVLGVVAWRVLAPPSPPPEMELPFAEPAAEPASGEEGAAPAGAPGPGGAGAAVTGPGDEIGGEVGAGGEVVVHVAGAVMTPGVQRLPGGARVIDGVDAAGGALPDADLARVNLAAPLVDGQQVYVPRRGEVPPVPLPDAGADGADGAGAGPVDVNQATADQLDELPGVGPATAEAIIAHRDEHGPFASVDDLLDVRGIGEAKLEQLRDLVTV
jgi:competence protein ComEA